MVNNTGSFWTLFDRMYSSEGRIGRKKYFAQICYVYLMDFAIYSMSVELYSMHNMASWVETLCIIGLVFAAFMVNIVIFFANAKRLHDIGRSGNDQVWLLLSRMFFMGIVYLTLAEGSELPNEYGMPEGFELLKRDL